MCEHLPVRFFALENIEMLRNYVRVFQQIPVVLRISVVLRRKILFWDKTLFKFEFLIKSWAIKQANSREFCKMFPFDVPNNCGYCKIFLIVFQPFGCVSMCRMGKIWIVSKRKLALKEGRRIQDARQDECSQMLVNA